MPPASARSDALALGLSLGAAATSAYVLWKTTQEPKPAPKDKKLEKKLKQQARSRKIESLIMERGQAGTKDYRVHVLAKGEEEMTVAELSLWHDVPLVAPSTLNTRRHQGLPRPRPGQGRGGHDGRRVKSVARRPARGRGWGGLQCGINQRVGSTGIASMAWRSTRRFRTNTP